MSQKLSEIIEGDESGNQRPVVLVGHDLMQDLKFMKKVGYNVWQVPNILDEVDTKSLFQRLESCRDGRSLSNICYALDMPGINFHNAGNDATYTLRAMISIVVRQMRAGPIGLNMTELIKHNPPPVKYVHLPPPII